MNTQPDIEAQQQQVAAALDDRVPTAVVIVHGMGEQRPLDTLKGFVRTALKPVHRSEWDYYYSRPAEITGSYEARRYIAPTLGRRDDPVQGQTEIFEYHWSYLMTGNRFGDLWPTTLRLLLQRPKYVPPGLLGVLRIAWAVLVLVLVLIAVVGLLIARNQLPGWVSAIAGIPAALGVVGVIWRAARNVISSFVDVVRYLDTSPRSYAARRAIRGGLVDLIHALHDGGRFARVIIVAHSLGGFIAYDALMSAWAEMHRIHAGPPDPPEPDQIPLNGLAELQGAAHMLLAAGSDPDSLAAPAVTERAGEATDADDAAGAEDDKTPVDKFQVRQFELWKGLRRQGNPWRITDFVTVGTPMAFADLLLTRPGLLSGLGSARQSRELFNDMVRRAELVRCPPRSESQHVEDTSDLPATVRYCSSRSSSRQVLGSQSLFAVVRWTNLWFPVIRGQLHGDWFGGPLHQLFGPGIRDIEVNGNVPGRLARGIAHSRYFSYPEANQPNDIAYLIRQVLDLSVHRELVELLNAPAPDPRTVGRRVRDVSAR